MGLLSAGPGPPMGTGINVSRLDDGLRAPDGLLVLFFSRYCWNGILSASRLPFNGIISNIRRLLPSVIESGGFFL